LNWFAANNHFPLVITPRPDHPAYRGKTLTQWQFGKAEHG